MSEFNIILATSIFILTILIYGIVAFQNGKDIVEGLKGQDKIWQAREIVTLIGLVLFVSLALASSYGKIEIPSWIPPSLDMILIFCIGTKTFEHINEQKMKNQP